MTRGISRAEIPEAVLGGMAKAAKAWDALHGTWASEAPEYWFTVTVAQHLQIKLDRDKNWIQIEGRVKETLKQAGVTNAGRPRSALRHGGKCDIVVTHANEKPFAAIEIKTRAYAFHGAIKKDVGRLREMLTKNGANSLKIGCLALYVDASKPTREESRASLKQRFEANLKAVSTECNGGTFVIEQISKIGNVEGTKGGGWGVQCLYIVRR